MQLKLSLLGLILENSNTTNKYSKAYLNLKNVFDLENKEDFEFTKDFIKKFKELSLKYDSFINNIPLEVIEKYYNLHIDNLEKYIYIEYRGFELEEYKTIDLGIELEDFYKQIFSLACEIANYYNLEVKLNNKSQDNRFI